MCVFFLVPYPSASVSVSVCAWLCPSFCAIIYQMSFGCIRLSVFFLGTTYQCECLCLCVYVHGCFLQNNSSELMWVHLLLVIWVHLHVHLYSLGHIPVRVCVCKAVPFFLQIIPSDFISLHLLVCLLCIRFCVFPFLGPHSSTRVCMHDCALLFAK